jgi:hypothetical protein
MRHFISGAIAMAFFIAGLFFLRFWKETSDRLFVMFAAAFWVFALSRVGLSYLNATHEGLTFLYAMRLLAFILILVAIVDKNRSGKDRR